MRRFVTTILAIGGLVAASLSGAGGGEKKKDKGADGSWVLVGMEQDGKKLPAEAIDKLKMTLTIKGEKFTITMDGKVIDKGTSKFDDTKKPVTVDIKSEDGPNAGKTILAIVVVDGDSMKACYDLDGKTRPKEFSTTEGSGHVLILYKRAAKKKAE